jgi:hypothetical protein
MRDQPQFRVRGFASLNHPRVPPGERLVSTLHRSERDAAIEIRAWQARMRIGDVSHAHLIDLRPGGKLTNRNILADTKIAWSWLKATSR